MTSAASYFELASDISSKLVGVALDTADDEITDALHRIADFFVADCCLIFKAIGNEQRMELAQAVNPGGAASSCSITDLQELASRLFHDILPHKQSMCLRVPEDLSRSPELYRARLAHLGIESLLVATIYVSASITYICALVSKRLGHAWPKELVSQFHFLAEILVSAMCRRSLEDSLQRVTRDLAEAQRICRLGSWQWNIPSGRIMELEEVGRILGVTPGTLAEFMELVHVADRDQLRKAIDSASTENGDRPLIEYRMHTRRGDIRIIRSRFEVIHSKSGPRMTGTFHDVTAIRRGEQELQLLRARHWHADRVMHTGVLVSSLAHELSQPLAAILANATAGLRFLHQEPLDRQELHDILADIVEDNRRATSIIDALRAMIRGKKTERINVDVADIAREVVALLHSEFVVQQIEVRLSCESASFTLADKTQIEQVLLNLVMNGLEAMQNQPAGERRLWVCVNRIHMEEVQVSVRDSGVGIPKDQLHSVFEAFWTTKSQGLGMGLEVCRSIVEAHGGRIWAENNSDLGATFVFRLPLAENADTITKT